MKRAIMNTAAIAAMLFTGCDDHRDLYSISAPALQIESDWVYSLNKPRMQEATAMLYKRDMAAQKEYFSTPNIVRARASQGIYDILIFNGIMESERITNLDHIFFRGTGKRETFEACAQEGTSINRLSPADNEFVASNSMELFACAQESASIEGDKDYYLKYKNGKNGYPVYPDFIETLVEMTPKAVSYRFQVKLTNLVNPTSSRIAVGALQGFSGSAFLFSEDGIPVTGSDATHHLNLKPSTNGGTNKTPEGWIIGTALSPVFVSFGPPLPRKADDALTGLPSSGRFSFDMKFLLTDNTDFEPLCGPVDITPQVNEIIGRIYRYHSGEERMTYEENMFTIVIDDEIFLPIVKPENVVDVEEWDDGEEIIIWM